MVILASLLASTLPAASGPESARVPVTARDLVEVAEIMGPSLSPDGERVAFRVARPSVEANETRLDWYVADLAGTPPVLVGSAGAARHDGAGSVAEQAVVWDPDSRGFRFLALDDGAVAIWHWRASSPARREIGDPADIQGFTLSDDGSAIRYKTGATRAEVTAAERRAYDEGVLIDDSVDLGQPVAGGKIEGGKRIMQRWNRNWFDRAPILWDAPKKETIVPLTAKPQGSAAARHFSPPPILQGRAIDLGGGDSAAIEGADDVPRLAVTRADGSRLLCKAASCRSPRLAAIARRPGHDMLILFEAAEGARENIWLWRIGDGQARHLATTDGAMRTPIRAPRCAAARNALICAESTPTTPPRLVRIAYDDARITVMADPNADLRARIDAIATPLRWKNGTNGILLRPRKADGPLPLVIQYYRCDGFLKGGVGDEIPMIPLVEHGIAVLCLNGKRPPPGASEDVGYDVALAAIGEAIDDLAASGRVDPARVGIGGLSFGSTVVTWAIRKSRRFAAATISSGQITPHYYWSNAVPDRGFVQKLQDFWKIGDPDSDPDRWRAVSPVYDIASIDTPLLMQLPESEVRNLAEFNTKLKLAGKPAELFAFADEIHIKYQPAHKRAVYERNLDWYRFWLKGEEEDTDPAKAGQYRRWRSYRAGQSLPVSAR